MWSNEPIGQMVERIVREELVKTLKAPPPRRLAEFVTDPNSKEYSMSRLCLGLLVGGVLAVIGGALARQITPEMVKALGGMLIAVVISVAGIYGANSYAGARRNGAVKQVLNGLLESVGGNKPVDDPGQDPLAAE